MDLIEQDSAAAVSLTTTQMGWLTTVRADGQPQSSYVWFHFDGQDLLLYSEPHAPKVRNIKDNPRVSFHLDGDGSFAGVLTIEGTAEIAEVGPDRLAAFLAKYAEPVRDRMHTTPAEITARFSVALLVTPSRLRSWLHPRDRPARLARTHARGVPPASTPPE